MTRILTAAILALLAAENAVPAEELHWVQKPELTFEAKGGNGTVSFELSAYSDVEVSIVGMGDSVVIRHLAAGVLGAKAPPPLLADSLAQKIGWDGKDDYGDPVRDPSAVAVRVRAGMGVELDQIVGGDPYAYYSEEMGDNDHSPWGISGLEAKPDGKVYVWGHSSNLGPPALRQYDIGGNYLRTLFPMPAGKDVEAMRGWGIHVKPDGSYAPKFSLVIDPSLTTTFLDTNLRMARMLPNNEANRLTFLRAGLTTGGLDTMVVNTDGTIAGDPGGYLRGPLVAEPPFVLGPVAPDSHVVNSVLGPVFVCNAPDGKSFYLSGAYAATTRYGSLQEVKMDGFWRDGRVWKVDAKSRSAEVFFSLDKGDIPVLAKERELAYGGSHSYSAVHGVAVDADGHIFVCDRLNRRIVVLNPKGETIREIPVEYPDAIALSKRTGALYVTTRLGDYHRRGEVRLLKFDDWQKSSDPSAEIEVSKTGYSRRLTHSYVVVCDTDKGCVVWVASTQMPVHVYRDGDKGLELLKDFKRVEGAQRCLGFDRMQVDPKTENVYVLDAHDAVWRIGDWTRPEFVKVPVETASIAIDPRNRHLYTRTLRDGRASNATGRVARFSSRPGGESAGQFRGCREQPGDAALSL